MQEQIPRDARNDRLGCGTEKSRRGRPSAPFKTSRRYENVSYIRIGLRLVKKQLGGRHGEAAGHFFQLVCKFGRAKSGQAQAFFSGVNGGKPEATAF